MENNAQTLQAVLYAHGGEMKKKELAEILGVSDDRLAARIHELTQLIAGQGIELLETEKTLSLRTASTYSEVLDEIQRKDNEKDIGTAGLEVLAIVLYKGDVPRSTIDYIRGVNSSGTLRQLVLRGLLERSRSTEDSRAWLYSVTPELLAHIGVSSVTDLPEYDSLTASLATTPHTNAADTVA
jgi:segregation and condensation protein B